MAVVAGSILGGSRPSPGGGGGITSWNGDTGPAVTADSDDLPNASGVAGATTSNALDSLASSIGVFGNGYAPFITGAIVGAATATLVPYWSFSTPSLAAGTYAIHWSISGTGSNSGTIGQVRCTVGGVGFPGANHTRQCGAVGLTFSIDFFYARAALSGVVPFVFQIAKPAGAGTYTANEGRVMIWRVS